jgi:xylulokinase
LSLLGIDLGTSGIKAAVFSQEGKMITEKYREYSLYAPKPGIVELDPNIVWESLCANIKEINAQEKVKDDPIMALSISVSGDEALPVNKNGEPLYNTIMSMDSRTIKENEWINEKIGTERLYEITGQPPSRIYPLNKLLWFKKYKPEIFKNIYKFLCWEDFIFLRLGIDPVTDFSIAARTLAFDINRKKWSDEILDKINICKDLFPIAVPSGTEVGKVRASIAYNLGFKKKVSIITGGFDQNCAALGAGVVKKGMASVGTGTMEAMQVCFDKFISNKRMLSYGYSFSNHVVDNFFISLSTNFCAGALVKWYRDNFTAIEQEIAKRDGKNIYDVIMLQAKHSKFPVLLLPYFEGAGTPRNNPNPTGTVLGLTLATKREDIIRGILEGIAFDLRLNIEKIQESGVKIETLRNTGGGSRSDFWLQLKADITGRVIQRLDIEEAGCISTSVLAGFGVGIFNTVEEVIKDWIKIKKEFYPNKKKYDAYSEKYQQFLNIYNNIKDYKILH